MVTLILGRLLIMVAMHVAFCAPTSKSVVVEQPTAQGLEQVALYLGSNEKMELIRNSNFLTRDLEDKQSSLGLYEFKNGESQDVLRILFKTLVKQAPRSVSRTKHRVLNPHILRLFVNDVPVPAGAKLFDAFIDLVQQADASDAKRLKKGVELVKVDNKTVSVKEMGKSGIKLTCPPSTGEYKRCAIPRFGSVYFLNK